MASVERELITALAKIVQRVELPISLDKGQVRRLGSLQDAGRQINEVLCRVLCHNVRVLIQSMYELDMAARAGDGGEAGCGLA